MNINFYEAFSRHDADAALLLKKRRWANADHLLGLAAECALKAILLQQGIQSKNGDMDRPYRDHINLLWDRYQNFMQTRNVFVIPDENPFRDWNIAQRYAPATPQKERLQNRLQRSMAQLSARYGQS